MKRVTIKDVAKEAGVSITTVSHALSGQGVLRQETRDRIVALARSMQIGRASCRERVFYSV